MRAISVRLPVLALAFAAISCRVATDAPDPESNLGFSLCSNLPCLGAVVNGSPATLVVATSLGRSTISSELLGGQQSVRVLLGNRTTMKVRPVALDEARIPADGILGADVFRGRLVTIDYFRGLLTLAKPGRARSDVTPWYFTGGPPRVPVRVNGTFVDAIVDTALPGTALIPRRWVAGAEGKQAQVDLEIAGVRFDGLAVAVADVTDVRIGNRVLSRYIVTIDYEHESIGLWPDPRTDPAR